MVGKRKSAVLIDSDDSGSSSGSDSGSDIDKDMLSLAKKKGSGAATGAAKDKKVKVEAFTSSSASSSSGSGSDSDGQQNSDHKKSPKKSPKQQPAKRARRSTSGTTQSSVSHDGDSGQESDTKIPPTSSSVVSSSVDVSKKTPSDLEEGEVSDDDLNPDDDEEEFTDGYDENMMGDAEDQRRLNAMTEKEREQEIFRRIEKRDQLKGRFEAERKLRRKKKLEAKLAKKGKKLEDYGSIDDPSSEAFQMDAKVRSQERKKTVEGKVDKKTQAMDALKASRDAKIQRQREKEQVVEKQRKPKRERGDDDDDDDDMELKKEGDREKKERKLRAADVYSDDSGSDFDDDRKDSKDKDKSTDTDSRSSDSDDDDRSKKTQYVENLEDLVRIKLSRFKLEKWIFLPFFSQVVKNCYVRLGMCGPGGRQIYRICEVLGVVESYSIYDFANSKTKKVLNVRYGNAEKKFKFEFVSNQSFTTDEFTSWKELMAKNDIALPTLDDIKKKEQEIKDAMEYQLQEEDIETMIHEKNQYKDVITNFAMRKTELMKQKEELSGDGKEDEAKKIDEIIQELDERAKKLDRARTSTISSISYINERNRKRNVEEAEKAILEELKTSRGLKVEDPFTRRNTKPRIVSKPVVQNGEMLGFIKTEGGGFIKTEAGVDDDSLHSLDDTKMALEKTIDEPDSKFTVPLPPAPLDDMDAFNGQIGGDLFSAHDFDIKLDLDAKLPPNLPIVARPSMTPIKETAPRRSLNLEEYKRKKGLI